MRTLQLVLLALLATAARGDLTLTGTVSILEFNPDIVLFHSDSECSGFGGASVFALCSADFTDGRLTLNVLASGDGCDGCHPTFGAENTALATFTDQITFYGPSGGTAAVTWFFEQNSGAQVSASALELPTVIQFNTPYDILLSLSGFEAAFGNLSNSDSGDATIEGFLLYNTSDSDCSTIAFGTPFPDPACGPPIDASIQTQSGFLYGGHAPEVPEPSTLLLLATAAGLAFLVSRSGRIAYNFRLR